MYTQHRMVHRPRPLRPPARPMGLYGLRAASEMFSAAVVLPEQFHADSDGTYKMRGVVALMCAVLEEAVHCWQQQSTKSGRRAQRLTREAEEWIFSDDARWLFSFVNICAALNLDPAYIRRGLTQLRQHSRSAPQKTRPPARAVHRPLQLAAYTSEKGNVRRM